MTAPTFARIAYSVEEAADACGLSPDTIRAAIATGELVANYPTKGRAKAVIRAVELDEWLSGTPTERGN